MKRVDLSFVTRVKLLGILGGAQAQDGGLDKLHALLRVFERVRFSDEEMAQITITPIDEHTSNYRVTNPEQAGPDFGSKTLELEEAHATWLLRQLKVWMANATIHDLEWLDPLMEALERGEFRRKRK